MLSASEDLEKHTIEDKAEPIGNCHLDVINYLHWAIQNGRIHMYVVLFTCCYVWLYIVESVSKADVILEVDPKPVQPPVQEVPAMPAATTAATDEVSGEKPVSENELSSQEIEQIEDVLEQIAKEKEIIDVEEESLNALKEDIDEYQEVRKCPFYTWP